MEGEEEEEDDRQGAGVNGKQGDDDRLRRQTGRGTGGRAGKMEMKEKMKML